MQTVEIMLYLYVFILGVVVGSFCNVCILRIPLGEDFVKTPSHCTNCGKRLCFWELVPIFSYLALRGKCSKCKNKISPQYILIEISNGLLWLAVFFFYGFTLDTLLGCLLVSTLLVLSVIDARTTEIPIQTTIFIGVLGVLRTALHFDNFELHMFGFIAITLVLFIMYFFSNGKAIGGGDVKLMAGCGLFLGLAQVVFAFVFACLVGSVVHIVRMKFFNAGRVLAMGPYLAFGVFISFLFGEQIIQWYFGLLGL